MSRLPPSSSVRSWVTTTALSTAPSMNSLHWTLSFTRTSRPSRSGKITLGLPSIVFACSSRCCVWCLITNGRFTFDLQRYDGDVGDLGLTLSYDEDVMGQVRMEDMEDVKQWLDT